ncbi:MAG TPA: hypothetical protein VJH03_09145 [Blastocatellia bacterium]|nr:hypothetical protein [Blastocatellia bacterium]
MRKIQPIDPDELDDQAELHDEELRRQIADGHDAYLRGEATNAEKLLADLLRVKGPESGKMSDA